MIKDLIDLLEDLHGTVTEFEIRNNTLYIPSSELPISVIMVNKGMFSLDVVNGNSFSGLTASKVKGALCQLFA